MVMIKDTAGESAHLLTCKCAFGNPFGMQSTCNTINNCMSKCRLMRQKTSLAFHIKIATNDWLSMYNLWSKASIILVLDMTPSSTICPPHNTAPYFIS